MADSEKMTVESAMATLAAKTSELMKKENTPSSKMLIDGQTVYLVAIGGPYRKGVSLCPKLYFDEFMSAGSRHSLDAQVICEMVLNGNDLTISQCLGSVVFKERQ